jgi:hypothetical protein
MPFITPSASSSASSSQRVSADTAPSTRQIFHCNNVIATARFDRLCIVLWRGAVTPAGFEQECRAMEEVARACPDGFAVLSIIEAGTKPPTDPRVRKGSADVLTRYGDQLRAATIVLEETGFRGAIHRAVLTGIQSLYARRGRTALFRDVPSAIDWLGRRLPIAARLGARDFVENLRAQLHATPCAP